MLFFGKNLGGLILKDHPLLDQDPLLHILFDFYNFGATGLLFHR